jgi:hypothetical protein
MKIQHIPNKGHEWETIVVPQYQNYPKQRPNSAKAGSVENLGYTPPLFKILKFKYDYVKK